MPGTTSDHLRLIRSCCTMSIFARSTRPAWLKNPISASKSTSAGNSSGSENGEDEPMAPVELIRRGTFQVVL